MNQKYNVTGMSCSACSAAVEKSVKKLEGVEDVNVNLLSNSMTVHFDESILDDNSIISARATAPASLPTGRLRPRRKQWTRCRKS